MAQQQQAVYGRQLFVNAYIYFQRQDFVFTNPTRCPALRARCPLSFLSDPKAKSHLPPKQFVSANLVPADRHGKRRRNSCALQNVELESAQNKSTSMSSSMSSLHVKKKHHLFGTETQSVRSSFQVTLCQRWSRIARGACLSHLVLLVLLADAVALQLCRIAQPHLAKGAVLRSIIDGR